jgi:uncharacterized protein (DUF58 family)
MTANRLAYAVLILLTALFAVLFDEPAAYAAFYVTFMLPLLSWCILLYAKQEIKLSEKLDTEALKKGETAVYTVAAHNTLFFFGIKAEVLFEKIDYIDIIPAFSFTMPPRKRVRADIDFRGLYRGIFPVRPTKVQIYDLLGLFRVKVKMKHELKITVLPHVHTLDRLHLSDETIESRYIKGWADDSDGIDLSQYQYSDGHKRIHWPLSAIRGELIGKNYYAPMPAAISVTIDNSTVQAATRTEALTCEDALVEAAVSVMRYCTRLGMPVYLNYMGQRTLFPTLEFNTLYAATAEIMFNRVESFSEYFLHMSAMQGDARTFFVFTSTLSEHLTESVRAVRLTGNEAAVFHYVKEALAEDANEITIAGARYIVLSPETSVNEAVAKAVLP